MAMAGRARRRSGERGREREWRMGGADGSADRKGRQAWRGGVGLRECVSSWHSLLCCSCFDLLEVFSFSFYRGLSPICMDRQAPFSRFPVSATIFKPEEGLKFAACLGIYYYGVKRDDFPVLPGCFFFVETLHFSLFFLGLFP